jgi:hypothetical protein
MSFFPNHSEVLVSTLKKEEILKRLHSVTKNENFLDYNINSNNVQLFNGNIGKSRFRISLVINRADSFLPLIKGEIESTPSGSILFLEYSLFPGSVFFLGFWTILTAVLALIFTFLVGKIYLAVISLALGIGNYWFAWAHFKRKIKISQGIFLGLLNN